MARLTIVNEGSAPAGDVQVHLKLNAPGMAFVEPSRLDKAPKPPKFPKHQWDSLAALSMIGPRYGPPLPRPKPSRLLKVPDETDSVYELDRLMHGLPETVDIPILLDPSSAASGTLSFSTHADGQPAATHGEIAIVVSD
jgi:hypothetical protein